MTRNKLAVYFVADIVLADMVVADIDFPCGRYGFFAVADIVLLWPIWLWPIWFVADMVAPRNCRAKEMSGRKMSYTRHWGPNEMRYGYNRMV